MVRLIVGKMDADGFFGHCAEFAGVEISSYTDRRGAVYTRYKCSAYTQRDAYRVHISDETHPEAPIYQLLPYDEQSGRYLQPYNSRQVAAEYPLFIKHIDLLESYPVDGT
jgi:hypothetical protein